MKIRNGFISNSSSTSFVLAVIDRKECKHCGSSTADYLDLLYYHSECKQTCANMSANHYKEQIADDISEYKKDLAYLESLKKQYEGLQDNRNFLPVAEMLIKISNEIRDRQIKQDSRQKFNKALKIPDVIKSPEENQQEELFIVRASRERGKYVQGEMYEIINKITHQISNIKFRIKSCEDILAKLDGIDKYGIYEFTVDNSDKVISLVELMESKKMVKVLSRKTS